MPDPQSSLGILAAAQTRNQLLSQIASALTALGNGSAIFPSKAVTGTYDATKDDFLLLGNGTGGAVTVNLPASSEFSGTKFYVVAKTDSSGNDVTAVPNGTETISGAADKAISAQYGFAILASYPGGYLLLSA